MGASRRRKITAIISTVDFCGKLYHLSQHHTLVQPWPKAGDTSRILHRFYHVLLHVRCDVTILNFNDVAFDAHEIGRLLQQEFSACAVKFYGFCTRIVAHDPQLETAE